MKNIKFLGLLIIFIANLSYGQGIDKATQSKAPLILVITSSDTVKGRKALIDPSEFKSMNVIQNVEATKRFGIEGEFGAVEVKLNPGVEILDIAAFKRFYKIAQFKIVHISVDGSQVLPTSLLVTKRAVKDLKKVIIKENEEINIEITTWHPKKHFQPGLRPMVRG